MMTKGGVGDTVALGRVGSGLTAEVAMEDGSDLGFLASDVASRSPYSTPSLLSESPKAASNRSHSLGTGAPASAVMK